MRKTVLGLWLGAAVILGACTTTSPSSFPKGDAAPPPSESPQDDAAGGAAVDQGGEAQQGSATPTKQPANEKRIQDTEACYNYANANVRNESQLDDDIAAGRGSRANQVARYSVLTKPLNSYYYKRQRTRLFESCMQSRGHIVK